MGLFVVKTPCKKTSDVATGSALMARRTACMQTYNCGYPRAILSRPVGKSRPLWLLTRKSGRWRRTQRWQRQASCLADRRTKSGVSCSLLRPISLAKDCPAPRCRRQWTSFLFRKPGRSWRRKRSFISVFPVNKVVDRRYTPNCDWRISIAQGRIVLLSATPSPEWDTH